MEDYEKKLISLKNKIRESVNNSDLPLSIIEGALDSIRVEVAQLQLNILRTQYINSLEEKEVKQPDELHEDGVGE